MNFHDFEDMQRLHAAWNLVQIVRPVHYSLFTFGESNLHYFLVTQSANPEKTVSIRQGEVRITRPLIITPDNASPELQHFFDDSDGEQVAEFLMSRMAAFSNLRLNNKVGTTRIVTDSVEEAVAKLNRQLDDQEEDHVAILTAPAKLSGLAIFRYATERIMQSTPDNIQELRERGFLPE